MKNILIENLKSGIGGCILGLFVGFIVSLVGFISILENDYETYWQQQIVDRGHALYCPNNGQWAWNGECKK